MALFLYYKDENDQFVEVTSSTSIDTVHDGQSGDVKTIQLYLRNDSATVWYSDIIISPVDTVEANPYGDIIYRETGWGIKLSEGAIEPSVGEWEDIEWGEQIEMPNIGNSSTGDNQTYYPFWYLITCPPNEDVKNKEDIFLKVKYTDNAVV